MTNIVSTDRFTPSLSELEREIEINLELANLPFLDALMPNHETTIANSIKGKFRNWRKQNLLPNYYY